MSDDVTWARDDLFDEIDRLKDEIERLRKGIQDYLSGKYNDQFLVRLLSPKDSKDD